MICQKSTTFTSENMEVTIIIPVYNSEAYLASCLGSILSQSFSDFEVLLIDDGSKDRSGEICDGYAARDSRIRVYHKENGGVSSARNFALEKATGEWVCFVDSDDQLCSGGLQGLVDGISCGVDLVMAGFIETDSPMEDADYVPEERKMVTREDAMKSMFNNTDQRFEGYTWAKLFRRDLIVKERLAFNPAIYIKEDTLFIVSYLCLSDKMVSVSNTPVYNYIHRPSSAMESLKECYNPKYLTSFEAIIQINRLVESAFSTNRQLLYISREEVINRVYRILAHMIRYDAVDKGKISQLKRQAFREVGIVHYLDYQFRRNERRLTRFINRVFKPIFHV